MRKRRLPAFISLFIITCILTAIYVALTERLSLENVAVGFVIAVIALYLTQKLFLGGGFLGAYTLGGYYVVYLGYLFYTILKSAAVSVGYIFSKDAAVSLVRYDTALQSDNLKGMLANAITLSPGTVTADIKGGVIEVMKLCKSSGQDLTADFARIENMIKHMDKGKAP